MLFHHPCLLFSHDLGQRGKAIGHHLLVAQRSDRLEGRRATRRIEPEYNSDNDSRGESEDDRDPGNDHWPVSQDRHGLDRTEPYCDADRAAETGERECFDQELEEMSRPRAPTARRSPISRVRSVTDTSMMFMIPIPPTTRETTAIPANSSAWVCDIASRTCSRSEMLRTEKSSGSAAESLWRRRRRRSVASTTSGTASGVSAETKTLPIHVWPVRRSCSVVMGIRTVSSWSRPKS